MFFYGFSFDCRPKGYQCIERIEIFEIEMLNGEGQGLGVSGGNGKAIFDIKNKINVKKDAHGQNHSHYSYSS